MINSIKNWNTYTVPWEMLNPFFRPENPNSFQDSTEQRQIFNPLLNVNLYVYFACMFVCDQ